MADSAEASTKGHRSRQSGPKADRKRKKKQQSKDEGSSGGKQTQRNAKAYTFKSAIRASRQARRTLDVKSKRMHVPAVDRTPQEPPPVLVAVVGPPKVGKSTLIASLIKNFTRQNLGDAVGPITVVSGRKRRLTFVECNNDISSMIDIAKVADLVLLLVDASFGFEMEVFEFLNVCQVHGFPRIMGVLTHLDVFKQAKTVRKTKKQLKHRFWTEIYQGAKLFYLSGLKHGQYPKMEVHNLGRFISVMKFRPLQWRGTHPYILSDRMEDLTDPERIREDKKCSRTVSLYGYVRGTYMKSGSSVHVAGVGDFMLSSLSELSDPCPLPDAVKRRRSLNDREQKIYAPMAGVGGIVYDKDAVYVDFGTKGGANQDELDERKQAAGEIVASLDVANPLDDKAAHQGLQVYQNDDAITTAGRSGMPTSKTVIGADGRVRRRAVFDDDSDGDEDMDGDDDGDEEDDEIEEEDEEDDEDDDDDSGVVEEGISDILDRLVGGGQGGNGDSEDEDGDDDEDDSGGSDDDDESMIVEGDEEDDDDDFDSEEDDADDDEEEEMSGDEEDAAELGSVKWKENIAARAAADYRSRAQTAVNLQKLVYGTAADSDKQSTDDGKDDAVDGLFKVRRSAGATSQADMSGTVSERSLDDVACAADRLHHKDTSWQPLRTTEWDDEFMGKLKNLFVTGEAADQELRALLGDDGDRDDELYGDFEDLETGEVHKAAAAAMSDGEDDDSDMEDYDGGDGGKKKKSSGKGPLPGETLEETRQRMKEEKKKKMREGFGNGPGDKDASTAYYDDLQQEVSEQAELNRKLFDGVDDDTRAQLEGFRPGAYVRLEIRGMPYKFVERFDPRFPIILGGLLSGEQNIGFVRGRIKKHRWHKRILKTRDPLIISLGWRRFQTVPVYSSEDHNLRQRFLKYTPEHMHCTATMYGPITPPGTGFLAVQTLDSSTRDFRIAAMGVLLDLDKSVNVVKKLKLVGQPLKVFKNTAFIKGMFTSAIEVAKYEGVAIRSVSGIRGQIKKAIKAPDGAFRATFEDKLLMSDIVFVRAWCPVTVPMYYNSVNTLLQEDKSTWSGMRTVGQMRYEQGIKIKQKKDSIYKPIVREKRRFNPLRVPKNLQKQLPFKSREKDWVGKSGRDVLKPQHAIRDPQARKVNALMQELNTIHKEKNRKKHLKAKDNLAKFRQVQEKQREKVAAALRRNKKDFYQKTGASNQKKRRSRGGDDGGDDLS